VVSGKASGSKKKKGGMLPKALAKLIQEVWEGWVD
jgi:hypothetical protein